MANSKKTILIKISGACIRNEEDSSIFNTKKLADLASQLKSISKTHNIGVVIGGGNIWRGNMTTNNFFNKTNADYMGLLSTVMNGIALKDALINQGVKADLYSALHVEKITKVLVVEEINKSLEEGKIVIFSGGTGHPYFTTDTGCVIRAIDIKADCILMGKNGVDGVYSDDPKKNKKATFYKDLTYKEAMKKQLKVTDLSALAMCEENNIDIYVFNIDAKDSISKVVKKQIAFTHVHK